MDSNVKIPTRYAFIDVQNTESTVSQLLGFIIDWKKMYQYLKKDWNCEKIFFYSGIAEGDDEKANEYLQLKTLGYEMQPKTYKIYKNPDKLIKIICSKCSNQIDYTINGGVRWKSNCDAELAVDATNLAKEGLEFIIFTGDGDFEYVIRNAIEKGVKVYVVSSPKKIRVTARYYLSRFSTKLRDLISEKKDSVIFLDINDWKMKIKKDI
ncbi:MAG: NYN domain-containing protein [Candidatus Taylorbacteria bacterium]